ncbi:hypothetical protein HZC31_01970 [Candidatus Woesearchaeota archaeon]|nr:hypothetical protein [Candidatus Woesearchaeota archaeon]
MDVISDKQINEYLNEKKILPKTFRPSLKEKNYYLQYEHEINGELGNIFKIIIRQSKQNPLDFSVILGVVIENTLFRLKRYNGDSHDHPNSIEKTKVSGFHIHMATQRYQEAGFREEGFAEKCIKYNDWKAALDLMLKENNFIFEVDKEQKRLN